MSCALVPHEPNPSFAIPLPPLNVSSLWPDHATFAVTTLRAYGVEVS